MDQILTAITVFFVSLLAIFGFGQQAPTAPNQTPTQVVFQGVSPCADCPGITTTLTLNYVGENNTSGSYTQTLVYQEKTTDPYTENGTWTGLPVTAGTLEALLE